MQRRRNFARRLAAVGFPHTFRAFDGVAYSPAWVGGAASFAAVARKALGAQFRVGFNLHVWMHMQMQIQIQMQSITREANDKFGSFFTYSGLSRLVLVCLENRVSLNRIPNTHPIV